MFKKSRKKLMWMSLGIILMSLTLFAFVITLVFDAVIYENVDQLLNQELHQYQFILDLGEPEELSKDYFPQLESGNFAIEEYLVAEDVESIYGEVTSFPNPKIITYIYHDDLLIYSTNEAYFKEVRPNLTTENTNGFIDFKQEGYNFRGQVLKKDDFVIQTIMNVDSEVGAKHALYQVIGMSFIFLITVNIYFVQKLIAVVFKPVEKSYELQTQFIQDVSHEMRTPLTIIKGQAERLMKQDTSHEEKETLLANIITEISDMQKLQRDLLVLSKVDIDNSLEIFEVNLSELVNELEEMYSLVAEFENKHFSIRINMENVLIVTDASKLKQCLIILLDNAFKYTLPESKIALVIEEQAKYISLKVKDDGFGISDEELTYIFNRFYRSSQEQIQNIEGSGIGLSILKALCERLNYKIDIKSELGVGTTFELKIPKKDYH